VKTPAAASPALLLLALALSACNGETTSPPLAGTPPPSPPALTATATPAARPAPPVSAGPSRWGLKLFRGAFAFFEVRVIPGANPEADAWTFEAGGEPFACAPERREAAWEFLACSGGGGNRLRAVIRDNDKLDIELTKDGEVLRERLQRVEERDEPASLNVELLWRRPNSFERSINTGIWAADGIVFAPNSAGVVELLEASTGARLGTANANLAAGRAPTAVQEVTARGGYLYVATTTRGVVVFDVRNPASPRLAAQVMVDAGDGSREAFTNVHTLTLSPDGLTLYAVNQSHPSTDLRIIDVSNPEAPREVGRYLRPVADVLDGFHDITVIDRGRQRIGFIASLRSGLLIVDLTDAKSVRLLGSITWENTLSHSGAAFEVGGRLYYAHNDEGFDQGMTVLDVTDLGSPKVVGRYQTRRGASIHNLEVVGNFAYVSYYLDGLRVVDLRDPARPREVAHYDTVPAADERRTFQGAWGVKVHGGRVFISDMQSGVFAFRVTLPN
jgi:choice-of-anchor B domain-containing protein